MARIYQDTSCKANRPSPAALKAVPSSHESAKPMTIHLRTWGDLACFNRPEMKVERVSYPVITPSAALLGV